MIRVSEKVFQLCFYFEKHFQDSTSRSLPYPHPRAQLLSTFKNSESFNNSLNCTKNHGQILVTQILQMYANIRIHFHLRHFNRTLKGKRGSELNKDRKLNMWWIPNVFFLMCNELYPLLFPPCLSLIDIIIIVVLLFIIKRKSECIFSFFFLFLKWWLTMLSRREAAVVAMYLIGCQLVIRTISIQGCFLSCQS